MINNNNKYKQYNKIIKAVDIKITTQCGNSMDSNQSYTIPGAPVQISDPMIGNLCWALSFKKPFFYAEKRQSLQVRPFGLFKKKFAMFADI